MTAGRLYSFARQVIARDKSCQTCGATGELRAHHIVPLSKGGDDTPDNGEALCRGCHADKHPNMGRGTFFAVIPKQTGIYIKMPRKTMLALGRLARMQDGELRDPRRLAATIIEDSLIRLGLIDGEKEIPPVVWPVQEVEQE
jgi:hypothetical protein